MPIRYRHWFILRLKKQLEEQNSAGKESNEPLTDSQKAAIKAQLPSNARRFM